MYFSCTGPGSRGAAVSGVSVSEYGAQRPSHTTAGNPLPDRSLHLHPGRRRKRHLPHEQQFHRHRSTAGTQAGG